MKELKRVFLSPRLLGLLGALLLINLFLFLTEDHREAEAFRIYNETLDEIRENFGIETTAIVTMKEVVEHLQGTVIDDELKARIDAYYEEYGVR